MKPSTQRMISLVASAALLVMTLVIFSSFIVPEYAETQDLRGRIKTKSELFGQQNIATTQIQKLIADYQGLANIQETLSLLIPREEAVPQALNQIGNIARANNLSIQSMSVQALPFRAKAESQASLLVKRVGSLRIDAQMRGTYEALKAFVKTVETNIRVMDIRQMSITPQTDPNRPYAIVVTIDTYYQEQ
ncbi:MAG: type 4a pilus biogenesis protein PilO [Candidatus Liptonbacteria bacterium]|nr:type 4a pilus biogenesis protein PilO [Candidatus Liptonbacteria bacterium]